MRINSKLFFLPTCTFLLDLNLSLLGFLFELFAQANSIQFFRIFFSSHAQWFSLSVVCLQIENMENGLRRSRRKKSRNVAVDVEGKQKARKVDKLSRRLFPASFALFNIIYWFYYTLIPWHPRTCRHCITLFNPCFTVVCFFIINPFKFLSGKGGIGENLYDYLRYIVVFRISCVNVNYYRYVHLSQVWYLAIKYLSL